jgi:hypothetical protein
VAGGEKVLEQEWGLGSGAVAPRMSRWIATGIGVVAWAAAGTGVWAEHEVDHRFTVEGYVCGADGKPAGNQEVMVKDTRIPLGKTVYTDSDGFYSITLHLHNENQGDPVLVTAGGSEQHLTAKFDAKDMKSERKMVVHFGSGCETAQRSSSRWVYYTVGLGLAGAAALAGAKMIRKQRRPAKRGKGPRA